MPPFGACQSSLAPAWDTVSAMNHPVDAPHRHLGPVRCCRGSVPGHRAAASLLHRRGLSASSNSRAASNRASGVMVAQWNLSCTLGLRLCLREAFAVAHQVLAG